MIRLNGREINLESYRVKVERRRLRGIFAQVAEEVGAGIERPIREVGMGGFAELSNSLREAMALHGVRLEPPDGYRSEGMGGVRLGKMRKKLISGVCGGYLQKQESFNGMVSRGLDAASRASQHIFMERGSIEHASWFFSRSRREAIYEGVMLRILEATRGNLVFIGLPGIGAYEKVLEKGRLLEGMDWNENEVFRYQSSYLPASLVRLADLAFLRKLDDCQVLMVCHLEELGCEHLCGILKMAERRLPPQSELWLCLGEEEAEVKKECVRFPGDGDVNIWNEAFLAWLMEERGFQVEKIKVDGCRLLRGRREW